MLAKAGVVPPVEDHDREKDQHPFEYVDRTHVPPPSAKKDEGNDEGNLAQTVSRPLVRFGSIGTSVF